VHWLYDNLVVPVYYLYGSGFLRHRASLILAGIEILPNLSILAILCIMADWGLLGLKFLSAVGGLRMEFSSTTPDIASLCPRHRDDVQGFVFLFGMFLTFENAPVLSMLSILHGGTNEKGVLSLSVSLF